MGEDRGRGSGFCTGQCHVKKWLLCSLCTWGNTLAIGTDHITKQYDADAVELALFLVQGDHANLHALKVAYGLVLPECIHASSQIQYSCMILIHCHPFTSEKALKF